MGFCSRCGEIVQGARCKCGGIPVAPVVQLGDKFKEKTSDRWSQTYVSQSSQNQVPKVANKASVHASQDKSANDQAYAPVKDKGGLNQYISKQPLQSALKKVFPRPLTQRSLNTQISAHIASTTSPRPPSPLKQSVSLGDADDIIQNPDATLSKVYGSILQPRDTLTLHSCAHCHIAFQPDATIFPDPTAPVSAHQFVCRACFTANGGSKGTCASCGSVVLGLANEGGFIESTGRVWHPRCFRCAGCSKDIARSPMVDLLGRPSCPACFESCLERPIKASPARTPTSNPGGVRRSRESSPAIEELQHKFALGSGSRDSSPLASRIGISGAFGGKQTPGGSRESSPAIERTSARLTSPLVSPASSPAHTPLKRIQSSPLLNKIREESPTPSISHRAPLTSRSTSLSPNPQLNTPTLSSAGSDTTASSPPLTPAESFSGSFPSSAGKRVTPKPIPPSLNLLSAQDADKLCASCSQPLFSIAGGGRIVTIPPSGATYHKMCFRCEVCKGTFEEKAGHGAPYVQSERGVVHPSCAPRATVSIAPRALAPSNMKAGSSLDDVFSASANPLPRFGGSTVCPGCDVSVAPMERGVVPGPQGTRWHAACLVCGGRGAMGRRKDPKEPGCAKRLDSAARTDREGGVWCRECSLLLPHTIRPSPQTSPSRATPLSPTVTGNFTRFPATSLGRTESMPLTHQYTGLGLLTRQYTGATSPVRSASPVKFGGGSVGGAQVPRQLTGTLGMLARQNTGAISPVRPGSPVKGAGAAVPVTHVLGRPRSALGIAGLAGLRQRERERGKSVDERGGEWEGRGMFLVRQMTGSTRAGAAN